MHPDSIHLTAFSTPKGLYEFTRMPFGLVTAPATYIRLMRVLLEGLDISFYFDNVIIASTSWPAHVKLIEQFFSRLKQFNLTVKPNKCKFGVHELKYLGFQLSKEGIKPIDEKVEAIAGVQPPSSKTALRSFLGMCGFYQKFIPNYAQMSAPLTDLLRKEIKDPLVLTAAALLAFNKLRTSLCQAPILRFPDMTKTFVVKTDASQQGIGAALCQYWGDVAHPIHFASRKLLPREQKYSTIERELLAFVFAISKFKYYLTGVHFILETDHAPLTYMRKFQNNNSKLMRWAIILQPYSFQSVYITGLKTIWLTSSADRWNIGLINEG